MRIIATKLFFIINDTHEKRDYGRPADLFQIDDLHRLLHWYDYEPCLLSWFVLFHLQIHFHCGVSPPSMNTLCVICSHSTYTMPSSHWLISFHIPAAGFSGTCLNSCLACEQSWGISFPPVFFYFFFMHFLAFTHWFLFPFRYGRLSWISQL